jgi:predicted enzyme related to lactoylglutathione lyase/uncharacterized protein YndB with AHSA1/START domain
MITSIEQSTKLLINRLIKAPRERVFTAWTTPADLLKWFGPETCQTTSANVNLRAGGDYHITVNSKEMGEVKLDGLFREVKSPSKLVYTWSFSGHPELNFGESQVTVEFQDRKGATEVQILHEQLPNQEVRTDHEQGWNGSLDKLEKYLASGAQSQPQALPVGQFSWNELMTSDEAGATKFYSRVFGWQPTDFPGAGMKYTIWKQGGKDIAGLMKRPSEDIPPHWIGYVTVANADATAKTAGEAGGRLLMPPFDVPTVGRIAILQDPQGATLGIFQPLNKPTACQTNQVVWCDIPVKDLDRSIRFYSAVLGATIAKEEHDGTTMAVLPRGDSGVSACLSPSREDNRPSQHGALIYLNCQGRLDQAIAAVQPNGGKVLQPKHSLGPYGNRAVVLDSEGNRIALHSV